MLVPYWSVCCCSEPITSFAINVARVGWIVVKLQIFIFFFPSFKSKAHTFLVKRCRRRINIHMRCILSWKQDLLNMKRSQLLCWNGFNLHKPLILINAVSLGVVRPLYSFQYAWLLGVCEGSVLVFTSESLFSIKKSYNNNKWVCMWVLHAIVLNCTGVPKPYVVRSPILKRRAALQLWPGTTSLIQRDCTTSQLSPSDLWGEERDAFPPHHSSRHYDSGEKSCVCV